MSDQKSVAFFSTKNVNQKYKLHEIANKVLDSYWYILGNEVKNFEEEFAQYVGVTNCISVANGSDALEIALRGVGVKSGDKVIAVANAGFYSSTAIHAIGAEPVYVDIEPQTLTMAVEQLAKAISVKPSAIIVTHLYGQLADIDSLLDVARSAGIPLIEDCAQAHGATRNGKMAGSYGDVACFSFYPTKNLGALGDGGAIATNSDTLATTLRQLRQYGWSNKYNVSLAGGKNSRLDELQAAFLRKKLPFLDEENRVRRAIATKYNEAFADLDLVVPYDLSESYVAHLYVVRLKERAEFSRYLNEHGINTDIHYPIADHHQAAYNHQPAFSLAESELACNTVISLPCYPGITEEEVDYVIATVRKYFNKGV